MDNHDLDIKNLHFTSEDTGSLFTKTYSEYKWKFTLDGIVRNLSLYHSKILGRRTIYLGDREICRYQRYTYNFHFSFPLDVHTISITQNEDTYILKIDGVSFNKLLNEQKLNRFNIIREIFSDKNNKNNKPNIKPLMTYKGGRGNMGISSRIDDSRRDNKYRTGIYNSNRVDEIENDKNVINTSTKRTNNNTNINTSIENSNNDYYYDEYNNYNEESSENMSNKAIDGGDSQRDEDEDEDEQEEDNDNKENKLNDIFQAKNNLEDYENDDDNEDIEEEENDEENIKEEIKEKRDEDSSSDEDKEKEKENEDNFININNENIPIKSNKDKKEKKEKNKNKSSEKKKIKKKENNKKEKINVKNNDIYNYDEDDIYNINNENNNINNENNENHEDLLGEEFYNSSRDKDMYNNNNIDNNFNINNFISQQKI